MRAARASAPGKVILFGEHAVVYGQPAVAVPVTEVLATATIQPTDEGITIESRETGRRYRLSDAEPGDPLAQAVRLTLEHVGVRRPPSFLLTLDSGIPMAAGLGSGAAVCTAIVHALADALGHELTDDDVSRLVFETEKLLHGTPSGIDNTVIAYARPVYFVRGQAPTPLAVPRPFRLLIGDTGVPSPTKVAVGDVRRANERDPERYQALFTEIGAIANAARQSIEGGNPDALGQLMHRNQARLRELGVSSPELEALVAAAGEAGALGAKLSGAGRGGNMLALITPDAEVRVRAALERAGARRVIGTTVGHPA